ncbi:hypothetical protein Tco_0723492 [Tanacetum coccineum]
MTALSGALKDEKRLRGHTESIDLSTLYTRLPETLYAKGQSTVIELIYCFIILSWETVAILCPSTTTSSDVTLDSLPERTLTGLKSLDDHTLEVISYEAVTQKNPL